MKSRWYKDAVVYQIYPRSFCDSNGDGIGDLRGIISKLDYIKSLGVDAVWLSPCYKSPNDDNGYDISDYRDIMDEFGTLEDWKEMVKGMHERGIRLIMDLVVNHTSDEHEWFKQSRSSKDNPYRDYYIWRKGKGKDGKKPPNNWSSNFVGSAWEYDETTQEYYLHLFSKKQPDLNWENPKVRQEVVDICNYWLDMGCDGFRCDVITYISKVEGLPDGKFTIPLIGIEKYCMGPKYHEYIHYLNKNSWSKYDSFTVGEAAGITLENAPESIDEKVEELDTLFSFEHTNADMYWQFMPHKLDLRKFKKILNDWQQLPKTSWNTLYLENHDQPRSIRRFAGDYGTRRKEAGKMLAVAMQMQRGTPFVYQGQEIGMTNIALKDDEYLDIMAKRVFELIRKIFPPLMPLARYAMARRARDHARTPMQWSDGENCGFGGTPWMKINPNYKEINVEESEKDPNSILNFYRLLHKYRKGKEVIQEGDFILHYPKSKDLFVYERKLGNKGMLIICNFKNKEVLFDVPNGVAFKKSRLGISNYKETPQTLDNCILKEYEACVYELDY